MEIIRWIMVISEIREEKYWFIISEKKARNGGYHEINIPKGPEKQCPFSKGDKIQVFTPSGQGSNWFVRKEPDASQPDPPCYRAWSPVS